MRFNIPARARFLINQNFLTGDVITDNIECISSDIDDDITYSFLENESNQWFRINSTSGVLSMATEAVQLSCINCDFQPTIVCAAGSFTNGTRITVSNQLDNQFTPQFTLPYLSIEVREDTAVGSSLITVNSTDNDRGDCGVVRYMIVSGNDQTLFRIGYSTGTLELVSPLDYETRDSYTLRLQVTNTICMPNHFSRIDALLTIIDVNDEPPMFDPPEYSATVNEFDSHPGSRPSNVQQLRCSDLDTLPGLIKYQRLFTEEPFDIEFDTGVVFVTPQHVLDYEERSFYKLQFKCFDLGAPEMFDIANLTVQIIPINEHSPELAERTVSISSSDDSLHVGTLIASNVPESEALVFINAVDSDEGDNHGDIYFNFQSTDLSYLEEYFRLDRSSGNITLIKSLTYRYCFERPQFERIILQLAVCEATVVDTQICPTFDISLFVTVSGNCTPSFAENSYLIQVNESVSIGTDLYNFTCNTPGTIDVANDKHLKLTGSSDVLTLFDVVNGTLVLRNSLDYENEMDHNFNIDCLDRISNLTASVSVNIEVLPSNDFVPKFTQPFYVYTLENEFSHIVGQVQAVDEDTDYGSELTYSIMSGDGQFLRMDSMGTLSLYEDFNSATVCDKLAVIVEVTDGLYTDQTMVLVNLTFLSTAENTEFDSGVKIGKCDEFCIAFAATLIILILSVFVHIMTVILLVLCYRRKQRELVSKIQSSILERTNSLRHSNTETSHYRYRFIHIKSSSV